MYGVCLALGIFDGHVSRASGQGYLIDVLINWHEERSLAGCIASASWSGRVWPGTARLLLSHGRYVTVYLSAYHDPVP